MLGLLELQSLWPFPYAMVRNRCRNAKVVLVVEMNMGQVLRSVKTAVDDPGKVYLANRVDGEFIAGRDIRNILRIIMGKGV
jgi:2-oxoglutarate ferredoxin oxidoreductase subunit alpha